MTELSRKSDRGLGRGAGGVRIRVPWRKAVVSSPTCSSTHSSGSSSHFELNRSGGDCTGVLTCQCCDDANHTCKMNHGNTKVNPKHYSWFLLNGGCITKHGYRSCLQNELWQRHSWVWEGKRRIVRCLKIQIYNVGIIQLCFLIHIFFNR